MKQKGSQSVKVAIRVRPLNKRETSMNSPLCVETNDNKITIKKEDDAKQFIFDHVFNIQTRQESIYETAAFSLMENALQGYNGTIFAYGQTGAGKTFTMVGDYKDPEFKGIIPRGFDHLIGAIHTQSDKKFVMRASFIEIYNEEIMDLLEDQGKTKTGKKDLKEDPNRGVFIKDLKMIPVKSTQQLFRILDIGNKNRTVFSTAMNAVSSRSHALFTVHVQSLESGDKVKASKINLVDLAGSQRASKTEATGDRLKEGAKINLSLSALGNVINALVDGKKNGHIPYRDSKLTRLLQDSLGGNTKTLMIASVSPAAFNFEESLGTLRYAARARNIKNTPKINEDPKDAMIRQYMAEIQKLKKQLGTGRGNLAELPDDIFSQDQIEQLKQAQEKALEKAEEKDRQLQKKNQELQMMHKKLQEMEGLVLKKQQIPQETVKNRKLKRKKIMKQQQLNEKKIAELQNQQQQLLQEKQEDNKEYQSIQKQCEHWKKIAKTIRKKLKAAMKDKVDLQKQFEDQREDLNLTIRQIQGDLSFYKQIASKFMSDSDMATVKSNSTYNQQKRYYEIANFLIHEDQITLPRDLKKYQVDDLWAQRRAKTKLEFLPKDLPEIKNNSNLFSVNQPNLDSIAKKSAKYGSPFIQNRRMLKATDYNDPIYQEKQYDLNRSPNIFRRTNFRMNQHSRSKSRESSRSQRSGSKRSSRKDSLENSNRRPTSRSRDKDKLQPIIKK